MEAEKIQELKGFVEFCKPNPHVLNTPSLAFFKNFLQSLGARIPAFGGSSKDGEDHENKKPFDARKRDVPMEDISNEDIVESDVELDNSDIVEPDNDPPQKQCESRSVWEDVLRQLENQKKKKSVSTSILNDEPGIRVEVPSLSDSELIERLREIQREKRCLIVLDDLWELDCWLEFKHPFIAQNLQGKISITTRQQNSR